ncbi:MAG: hypothetical protein ACM359_16965 [Bacillota bacterium]
MRALSFLTVSTALVAFVLAGCASHEVVSSSGPRPPTTPDQVTLYQKHPKRYEQLQLVTLPITPEMKWNERGDANAAFDALKAQAAAVGANGLLLIVNPGEYEYLVTAGYHGTFYQLPMRRDPKAAVVQAVFVLKK